MQSESLAPKTALQLAGATETDGTGSRWHQMPIEAAAASLQTDLKRGLSTVQAQERLQRYGPNQLLTAPGRAWLSILVDQFKSLIVALLVAATALAFALGEQLEAAAILIVIVINATIGFLTEAKAEHTLSALQKQAVPVAQVIREDQELQLPANQVVPGDILVLAAGARVPADGRIIESVQLQLEESALTGESQAVNKSVDVIAEAEVALGDRLNLAFMGTTITNGRGHMLVTATGAATEMGKIGALIDATRSRATPLEAKLARLGRWLILLVLGLCAFIVLAGWLRGHSFVYMLEIGMSLAIAAVPEGLPAVATMTLALGMQRMARMGALVRRLPAVETLGSTTVICTDKTGTLTKNEMTVTTVLVDNRRLSIGGSGYAAGGEVQEDSQRVDVQADPLLSLALRIAALCNDASLNHSDGSTRVLGDPTEAALLVAAEKAGFRLDALLEEYPRIAELPFDSDSKRMVTVHRSTQGRCIAMVKGSPGSTLSASTALGTAGGPSRPLTEDDRKLWLAHNEDLASAALRVLGLAWRELPEHYAPEDLGRELIFVGLVGLLDPLREEAKAAIAAAQSAGIRSVMITGDQLLTATEIARQLGIDRDPMGGTLRSVHARELNELDPAGWQKLVMETAVYARVSPKHKLQIVEALQAQGQIVAMTGDGVNDAPALKQADIGIAMGIKGTDVAKETADMVITDDNFATIVGAVEQGRIIYSNILRFIHYLFSCNFAEILTVFVAIMVGWPLPVGPLQILWLNMITDIFPALALALEPSAPGVMQQPPRDPKESLLTPRFIGVIVWQGVLLAAVTLVAFVIGMHWYGSSGAGLRHAVTIAFMTLALAQVFHAFNARSTRRSVFTERLFTNGWLWAAVGLCVVLQLLAVYLPILQRVLHTVPPNTADWGLISVCALAPLLVVELVKLLQRMAHPDPRSVTSANATS